MPVDIRLLAEVRGKGRQCGLLPKGEASAKGFPLIGASAVKGERGKGMKKHTFIDFCKRSIIL